MILISILFASLAVALLVTSPPSLTNYRWYRRWRGGHWERWYVDHPICSDIWHDVERCSLEPHPQILTMAALRKVDFSNDEAVARILGRPTSLCRGTPECEDWP